MMLVKLFFPRDKIMWPDCVNNLQPFENSLQAELPQFIVRAFQKQGIENLQEMVLPIQMIALLGKCGTETYMDCPNLPEWHVANSQSVGKEPAYYLANIGRYYWFDVNILDAEQTVLPLRIVFNEGDADCNDGIWGAAWDRNTAERVANFKSVGDCETEIAVVSDTHLQAYKPHDIWIPTKFKNGKRDDPLPANTIYAQDLELEKLIGLSIRWCGAYRSMSTFEKYV